MFKRLFVPLMLGLAAGTAMAAATVGTAAPAFTATDTSGKPVSLADFKGRTVVLEWVNPGCPFVQKHYNSQNMQATQKKAVEQGVVWLSVNSTHSASEDYKAPSAMAAWMKQQGASASATLMDVKGNVGRAYGARTTPHMYVIDGSGKLVYAGAIDSKPSGRVADIQTATNYVAQAVAETLAGKPVSVPTSSAYGCSIKFAPDA